MVKDLSKLILYTPDNAFKNVNVYTGSINFPTSLSAGQTATVTSAITLTDSPVFTNWFAYFLEETEAIGIYGFSAGTTPQRWYSGNVAGNFGIGIHVNSPAGNVGWINCGLYPIINGNVVTMTGVVFNGYSNSISLDALNVPFVFVEYTLAN